MEIMEYYWSKGKRCLGGNILSCQPSKYQPLPLSPSRLLLNRDREQAMAAAVGRAIDSFFSTIYYSVRYPTSNHHKSSSSKAYYYSSNHNSPSTYYFEPNYNKSMGRGQPLSLQVYGSFYFCTKFSSFCVNRIEKKRKITILLLKLQLSYWEG